MTKHLQCTVPNKAVCALILIPHADPSTTISADREYPAHPLSEDGVIMARRSKAGTATLIQNLGVRFGKPNVISGLDPKSLMTAFISSPTSAFSTNPVLDGNCKDEAELEKAAKNFTKDLRDQPLTVAYASPKFINTMLPAHRPKIAACRDPRLGIEAAVVFMAGNGRILGAHKLALLAVD